MIFLVDKVQDDQTDTNPRSKCDFFVPHNQNDGTDREVTCSLGSCTLFMYPMSKHDTKPAPKKKTCGHRIR